MGSSESAEPTLEVVYPDIIAYGPGIPAVLMLAVVVLVVGGLVWAATYRWRGRK